MTTTNGTDSSGGTPTAGAAPGAPTAPTPPAAAAGHFRIGGELPVHRMGFGSMRLPAAHWDGPAHDPDRSVALLRKRR